MQTHNVQLKGEVARYKRKFREKEVETGKLRKECDELRSVDVLSMLMTYFLYVGLLKSKPCKPRRRL